MVSKVTVSAKIDPKLREEIAKLGIKPSNVIRRALKEEVAKMKKRELIEKVKKASLIISKVSPEKWAGVVRGSRDERSSI